MPKNSHTPERSPSLTKSNLPKSRFLVHPWLLIVGGGVLSIAIASVAIISLTSTGRIAKDPSKQTTLATQKVDSAFRNWWAMALLGAGVATTVVIFKGRNLPIVFKGGRSRRQQRRLLLKQDAGMAEITPEIVPPLIENQSVKPSSPIVTVLPPERDQPSDLDGPSLAEMMDIRKHLSLTEILQDFKRPD
ncbi:hypothetical protein [Chlorogloea sp. CCALA 695]|uniref:hypothetical protein n=1 Tax=Chlorogloea sp. CCALA 695 TaxID=2107693 RepID=UPI000D050B37|nr:hypothetical protein [Chlorogloea sp. CCALA 695]PSB34188.1 hypothetical protein C7B70_04310 [Chlorogloea sp. CCALA 695]